jgi:hypothetical protein
VRDEADEPPLLREALPEFAGELERLLLAQDRPDLAAQLEALRLVRRDSCGQADCQSFYTVASRTRVEESMDLDADRGLVVIDLTPEGSIAFVEVLNRPDVDGSLQAAGFPRQSRLVDALHSAFRRQRRTRS